jgi:metallo-beta-lactamase family protein
MQQYPAIEHHGAGTGVTGSCHQLHMDAQHSLLVDCGLFQGAETSAEGRTGDDALHISFNIRTLKALLLTHTHIDHVGRLPYLLAAGYKGPILCSEPSAKLLPLVLEDAFRLTISDDNRQVQQYLDQVGKRIVALPYNHWFTLVDGPELKARIRLQRAGHILGSAYVECDLRYPATGQQTRVVFSGDLGAPYAPLLAAPKPPYQADILVLESTYGDRLHQDRRNRRQRLKAVIDQALRDNGSVLIPAFSVGRTQELLYELEDIIHQSLSQQGEPHAASHPASDTTHWPSLPVILDSPLASRYTQIYQELDAYWDAEAQQRLKRNRNPLKFAQLLTIDSHADHQKVLQHLTQTARPAIVIAASGMCTGGRIVNYLKAMLGDARHNVVFVGYQAKGTPGHAIQQYGPTGGYVDLDGERIDIKAGIATLNGYSAHADQQGLVNFATRMRKPPSEIRLVHGEREAKEALAGALRHKYTAQQLPLTLKLQVEPTETAQNYLTR